MIYEVCKGCTEHASAVAQEVLTSQFRHAQAAHKKAESLKIRMRIFRPSALDKL
jgi:hypothetical protein